MKFNDGSSTFVAKQFVQLINNAAMEVAPFFDGGMVNAGGYELRNVLYQIIHHAVYTVGTMDGDDRDIRLTVIEPNNDDTDAPGMVSEFHRFEFVLHDDPRDTINQIINIIAKPDADGVPVGYVHIIE